MNSCLRMRHALVNKGVTVFFSRGVDKSEALLQKI